LQEKKKEKVSLCLGGKVSVFLMVFSESLLYSVFQILL